MKKTFRNVIIFALALCFVSAVLSLCACKKTPQTIETDYCAYSEIPADYTPEQAEADGCICETSSAGLYAEANGGLATTDFRFEVDPNMNGTCVAMPTDGTESLCDVVNECIQELNASGQIEAWYAQYEAAAKALGVE